jgi:hypothetical protein
MDTISIVAAALGAAWASGINLYAAILTLGLMGISGSIDLPPELEILENPLVLTAAGLMYCVEFFADKIPGVDTAWDALHSFIRIPAGALMAGATLAQISPEAELVGLLLGGTLSAGAHLTKAGSRVLINASPEPVTNWTASLGEDVAVVAGLWTALNYPIVFIALLATFVVLLVWVAPKLWRGIRTVFAKIGSAFKGSRSGPAGPRADPGPEAKKPE